MVKEKEVPQDAVHERYLTCSRVSDLLASYRPSRSASSTPDAQQVFMVLEVDSEYSCCEGHKLLLGPQEPLYSLYPTPCVG